MTWKMTILAAAVVAVTATAASAQDRMNLSVGFSEVVYLDSTASEIIIGNPEIADISLLERFPHIIVSGRSLGATNLIILDQEGGEMVNTVIEVVPVSRFRIRVVDRIHRVRPYVCDYTDGCQSVGQEPRRPDAENDENRRASE